MTKQLHTQATRGLGSLVAVVFCSMITVSCLQSSRTASSIETYDECSYNVALNEPCKVTTDGAYITTNLGSNITGWLNSSGSTSVVSSIPSGFYIGKSVIFTSSALLPQNIRTGVSIFGVTGTYSGLPSTAHRDSTTDQIQVATEVGSFPGYAGRPLPDGYREVPSILSDDEGTSGSAVSYVDRSGWGGLTCGTAGNLDQRIANCALTFVPTATWDGSVKGNAGQSVWKLVTRAGSCGSFAPSENCLEVWRDERTGLLWSSRVSSAINWCKASGSNNITGNPRQENDPSDICDNASHQATTGDAVSACYDFYNSGYSSNFTSSDASITNSNGKGGMSSATALPTVIWRLPTLYDWQVANTNGIRFVLPDMGSNASSTLIEWTATVNSELRNQAWAFDVFQGAVSSVIRSNNTSVGARCVGH